MQVNLNRLFEQVKEEAGQLGIPFARNILPEIRINSRARKRYGCCKSTRKGFRKTYEIEIARVVLDCGEEKIREILAHELLHTCRGCDNHGVLWKNYAKAMNSAYGYNIKRTGKPEELGIKQDFHKPLTERYALVCEKCGTRIGRTRMSPLIKHPENYRCRCGGRLKRVK